MVNCYQIVVNSIHKLVKGNAVSANYRHSKRRLFSRTGDR